MNNKRETCSTSAPEKYSSKVQTNLSRAKTKIDFGIQLVDSGPNMCDKGPKNDKDLQGEFERDLSLSFDVGSSRRLSRAEFCKGLSRPECGPWPPPPLPTSKDTEKKDSNASFSVSFSN